jgi:hypothetical protein
MAFESIDERRRRVNPTLRENWLALALLDLLLTVLGFVFVARAGLRRLATGIRPRRSYEN